MAGTITPANVQFSIGSEEVRIVDAQLSLKIKNNCRYTECVLGDGKKGYLITKGAEMTRDGDLKVQTISVADKKSQTAIKTLRKKQGEAETHDNPDDYKELMTFSITTPGGSKYIHIKFDGFVREYKEFDPVGTAPPKQEADIEMFDPRTLQIEN